MKSKRSAKDDLGLVGFGAAACVAGIASTWLIGGFGLVIAALATVAFVVIRRRGRRSSCGAAPSDPVPVALRSKEPA